MPNFFDADAEAAQSDDTPVSERVASSPGVGGEIIPGVVFGKRMQVSGKYNRWKKLMTVDGDCHRNSAQYYLWSITIS